jgi:hypothetical protein
VRPARALLVRTPVGRCSLLYRLRGRLPAFVRRLYHRRVEGGAYSTDYSGTLSRCKAAVDHAANRHRIWDNIKDLVFGEFNGDGIIDIAANTGVIRKRTSQLEHQIERRPPIRLRNPLPGTTSLSPLVARG